MTAFASRLCRLATLLALPTVLAACGGGGTDNGGLFVSQMAATTLQYSRNMVITVTGSGLDKGLKVTVDSGCGEVSESAGGDALTRRFTCKVTAIGPKTVRAYTAGTFGPVIKTPTSPAIALESKNGLKNVKGSLAMARTSDPNSATSQFYINTVDNPALDYKSDAEPGYAVFGSVISGLDVIDRLNAVPVRVDLLSGLTHLPVTNVVIISALQTK